MNLFPNERSKDTTIPRHHRPGLQRARSLRPGALVGTVRAAYLFRKPSTNWKPGALDRKRKDSGPAPSPTLLLRSTGQAKLRLYLHLLPKGCLFPARSFQDRISQTITKEPLSLTETFLLSLGVACFYRLTPSIPPSAVACFHVIHTAPTYYSPSTLQPTSPCHRLKYEVDDSSPDVLFTGARTRTRCVCTCIY